MGLEGVSERGGVERETGHRRGHGHIVDGTRLPDSGRRGGGLCQTPVLIGHSLWSAFLLKSHVVVVVVFYLQVHA